MNLPTIQPCTVAQCACMQCWAGQLLRAADSVVKCMQYIITTKMYVDCTRSSRAKCMHSTYLKKIPIAYPFHHAIPSCPLHSNTKSALSGCNTKILPRNILHELPVLCSNRCLDQPRSPVCMSVHDPCTLMHTHTFLDFCTKKKQQCKRFLVHVISRIHGEYYLQQCYMHFCESN